MNVKSHHPLTEVIAKKLSGFSTVDNLEQYRMISRAAAAAVKWHEEQNTHCLLFSQYSLDRKMFPFHVCEQKQEIEKSLGIAQVKLSDAARTHHNAVARSTSMTSNSQRRAQSRNVVAASGELAMALRCALEIHELFPEHAKGVSEQ